MKSKNSLNPALVVERALAIVDAEGLDALTVRKVADEFGVTPMALYWHFSNKDALLEAVGDAVLAEPLVPGRILVTEAGRELTEQTLDKLSLAAFDVDKAAAVAHYALMIAMTLVTGEPGAETTVKPTERAEAHEAKLALLQSLPEDRYPRLRAAAPAMVECGDSDDYYGTAIDIFVAGVMAEAGSLATL